MPRGDDTIDQRYIETVWLVFHKQAGLFTTEPYEEKAHDRAKALMAKYGPPVYIIRTDQITRLDSNEKSKRIYKLEGERLVIEQELLV